MTAFRMPSLGADMDKATLVEWLKQPGEAIKRGDIIAVVETVKGAIEIEAFEEGVLDRHAVTPGESVLVGTTLAFIRNENDEGTSTKAVVPPEDITPAINRKPETEKSGAIEMISSNASRTAHVVGERKVSPVARKRAAEAGVDIARISSGEDGIIGLAQVNAFIETGEAEQKERTLTQDAPPKTEKPSLNLDVMRKAIGDAMTKSKREVPHYYVASTINCTALKSWLEVQNAKRTVTERLLYVAPLIKAVARALKETPNLNGFFTEGAFHPSTRIHVGVAASLRGEGLIAPAIHDTDELGVDDCMKGLRDLVTRVRTGRIRGSELSNPTVTISILGEDTADSVTPVIYPPQVAIIGCGAIVQRPWVVAEGAVEPRQVMTVTVAADHRASDGRTAARFLRTLDKLLQAPEAL